MSNSWNRLTQWGRIAFVAFLQSRLTAEFPHSDSLVNQRLKADQPPARPVGSVSNPFRASRNVMDLPEIGVL